MRATNHSPIVQALRVMVNFDGVTGAFQMENYIWHSRGHHLPHYIGEIGATYDEYRVRFSFDYSYDLISRVSLPDRHMTFMFRLCRWRRPSAR